MMDYEKASEELIEKFVSVFKPPFLRRVDIITRGEMCILNYLVNKKASVLPKQFSDALGISSARVAAALNSLQAKGEIVRSDDPSDRRRTLVTITEKGKKKVYSKRSEAVKKLSSVLGEMGETEADSFCRALLKFCDTAEKKLNI